MVTRRGVLLLMLAQAAAVLDQKRYVFFNPKTSLTWDVDGFTKYRFTYKGETVTLTPEQVWKELNAEAQ